MIIKVKKKHIKMGMPKDCHNCPVALALRERFNLQERDVEVQVQPERITIYERKDGWRTFVPSARLAKWIDDYDKNWTAKPGNFRLYR